MLADAVSSNQRAQETRSHSDENQEDRKIDCDDRNKSPETLRILSRLKPGKSQNNDEEGQADRRFLCQQSQNEKQERAGQLGNALAARVTNIRQQSSQTEKGC